MAAATRNADVVAVVSASIMANNALSVEQARRTLLERLVMMPAEDVDLVDGFGRVLAGDVVAANDVPGSDNSQMDGYAVVAADVSTATPSAPVVLPVRAESRAGAPAPEHAAGTATIISTGAPIPAGADAVIPVEQTNRSGDRVEIRASVPRGNYVRRRGEDVVPGTRLLAAGRRLRFVDVGACAAAGIARVAVGKRPRVALLSSGDELVAPGIVPAPYQATDINSAMLSAAVVEAGGIAVRIGVVTDDRAAVVGALEAARDTADIIVSSAGVSMSAHDHVRDAVAQLGEISVQAVNMRPGKPLVAGRVGATPFLGLPGNPVSSAVTFLLFARPAILWLQGATQLLPPAFSVILAEPFEKPDHLETYVRVQLESGTRGLMARSSGGQGSAMMHGLAAAGALAILPAGASTFAAGAMVQALQLP